MPKSPEDNDQMTAAGCVNQLIEVDDDGWFEPVFPPEVIQPPVHRPVSKPRKPSFSSYVDEIIGVTRPPKGTASESAPPPPAPTPAAPGGETPRGNDSLSGGDAETAQGNESPGAVVDVHPEPPRVATATELFTWIKKILLGKTHLDDDAAGLVAFWVISTWYDEALRVFPCLVITGPAHVAMQLLFALKEVCCTPALVAGFGSSAVRAIFRHATFLFFEPNLSKRSDNLLSSLTDPKVRFLLHSDLCGAARSTAIYAGENPNTHEIQNSIHIHLIRGSRKPSATSDDRVREMIRHLPNHLEQYREMNLDLAKDWYRIYPGVSSEMAGVASELERCIVGSPELVPKLFDLLKIQDKERLSEMSTTAEALTLEAILNQWHNGKVEILVGEIATEVNVIAKARGERVTYSAEKIGHILKRVGLPTRRLGKAGRGLVLDQVTLARTQELAALYGGAGLDSTEKNLHCQDSTENK